MGPNNFSEFYWKKISISDSMELNFPDGILLLIQYRKRVLFLLQNLVLSWANKRKFLRNYQLSISHFSRLIKKQLQSSRMKSSKIMRKKSDQSLDPTTAENQTKSSKIWGKHSLIFSSSKTQFMHGLAALAQNKAVSLSQSFEEDERSKQGETLGREIKNDPKTNPFLMVKARLLKQKQSGQTQNSSSKEQFQLDRPSEEIPTLQDSKTITFKQLLKLEHKKRKVVFKALTDRK